DVFEDLEADQRMQLHLRALVLVERGRLVQDRVRDSDLADVVEQKAMLETRVFEQARLEDRSQLERVALHSERVQPGRRMARLERVGERRRRLRVCLSQEPTLATLALEQPNEIARIHQDLARVLRRRLGRRRVLAGAE